MSTVYDFKMEYGFIASIPLATYLPPTVYDLEQVIFYVALRTASVISGNVVLGRACIARDVASIGIGTVPATPRHKNAHVIP